MYKQHDKSVQPMATTPSRISSAEVVISKRLSLKSLLYPFENTSNTFALPSRKVSLHFEHLEKPLP
jgi:hypothetical protein